MNYRRRFAIFRRRKTIYQRRKVIYRRRKLVYQRRKIVYQRSKMLFKQRKIVLTGEKPVGLAEKPLKHRVLWHFACDQPCRQRPHRPASRQIGPKQRRTGRPASHFQIRQRRIVGVDDLPHLGDGRLQAALAEQTCAGHKSIRAGARAFGGGLVVDAAV